jgi:hypothetical protein
VRPVASAAVSVAPYARSFSRTRLGGIDRVEFGAADDALDRRAAEPLLLGGILERVLAEVRFIGEMVSVPPGVRWRCPPGSPASSMVAFRTT